MDRQHWREQEKEDIKRQLSYWKDGANIERFDFNELIETVRLRIGRRIPCNDVYELLVRCRDVNCYLEYLLSYLSSTTGVGCTRQRKKFASIHVSYSETPARSCRTLNL